MKLYTPKEVADMFGMTPDALKSRRQRGQIEGIVLADNSVVYTQEQIDNADLSQRKRGPKPKAKSTEPSKPVRKRKKQTV
jgi:hypothetical protein